MKIIPMDEKGSDSNFCDNFTIPIQSQKELDRRLECFENGETTFYTWEEIKEELASKRLK